jgi:hypothetical protein
MCQYVASRIAAWTGTSKERALQDELFWVAFVAGVPWGHTEPTGGRDARKKLHRKAQSMLIYNKFFS